jgi:hypothetical protein
MEGEAELVSHHHAAAGKSQNETPRFGAILYQFSSKPTACLFTVFENH